MAITRLDGSYVSVTDHICAALGRGADELLTSDWRSFVHMDDLPDALTRQAVLVGTGQPYDVICRIRRPDHSWITGHFVSSRITHGNGEPPLIQSSAWFESAAPVPSPGTDETDLQLALEIQAATAELAKLAKSHRMPLVHHLLSIASLEAADQLHRRHRQAGAAAYPERTN